MKFRDSKCMVYNSKCMVYNPYYGQCVVDFSALVITERAALLTKFSTNWSLFLSFYIGLKTLVQQQSCDIFVFLQKTGLICQPNNLVCHCAFTNQTIFNLNRTLSCFQPTFGTFKKKYTYKFKMISRNIFVYMYTIIRNSQNRVVLTICKNFHTKTGLVCQHKLSSLSLQLNKLEKFTLISSLYFPIIQFVYSYMQTRYILYPFLTEFSLFSIISQYLLK